MFYGLRASIMGLFKFRWIPRMYWVYPGLPSIVVPYGDGADFYYSGHTGFMLMTVFFLRRFNYIWCSYLAIGGLLFMMTVLLLYRGHYSIGTTLFLQNAFVNPVDLAIALCASTYSYITIQRYVEDIHVVLRRITRFFMGCFCKK